MPHVTGTGMGTKLKYFLLPYCDELMLVQLQARQVLKVAIFSVLIPHNAHFEQQGSFIDNKQTWTV